MNPLWLLLIIPLSASTGALFMALFIFNKEQEDLK